MSEHNDSAMLQITDQVALPVSEVEFSAIRAQGAGGQNVNKVSSAVHLRFDIAASSLPDEVKGRLLALSDSRDRKSTRLNSSHVKISYAVFCLKKKKKKTKI